jgi:hypothetical protein
MMTATFYIEMHNEHRHWQSDLAMWRDDVGLWQEEYQ